MPHALLALLVATLLVVSCATPTVSEQQAATRETLAAFSTALARAGMSVPLAPRVCDEPTGAPRWDDEVGCLDGLGGDVRDALRVYARAVVRTRLGDRAEPRADALVDAYLAHDDLLVSLALAVERDFDATRVAKKEAPKKPAPKKRPSDESRIGTPDAGPVSSPSDAGQVVELVVAEDAGAPGDAGVVRSVHDRLVGTWVVATSGPVVNVYVLCADGRATVKSETSDASLAEMIDDLPASTGSWEVTQEEPPKIAFTWGSERYQGEITALSADSVTIDYGEETVTAERRSTGASCE